jgi:hypothetical protein
MAAGVANKAYVRMLKSLSDESKQGTPVADSSLDVDAGGHTIF